ncbi:MAG: helix-turn-helix domain-containing protein [Candidatus Coproplasma sp.]
MSDVVERSCAGNLLDTALDFVLKSKPELIFSAVSDRKALARVFADEALVSSCMSLFDNDLNVSLAAEKLYMHRNTLIYRIKKVERLTGLNVTKFSDAVDFIILYKAFVKSGI